MKDELASNSWKVIDHALLKGLTSRFLQSQGGKREPYSRSVALDMFNFLCSNAEFCEDSNNCVGDDGVAGLVQMMKDNRGIKDAYDHLQIGSQLSAATLLSQLCIHDKEGSTRTAPIQRLLSRFATNTLVDGMNSPGESSQQGVLAYAVNQSVSRDLTRRALNLQSILSFVQGEDSSNMSSAIFESAIGHQTSNFSLAERLARQEEQMELLNNQCRQLTKERDRLSSKLTTSTLSFERELRRKLAVERADAMDMAQVQAEEKREMAQQVTRLEEKLSDEKGKLDRALEEAEEHKVASRQMICDYKNRVSVLEEHLDSKEQKLKESKKQTLDKEDRLVDAASRLEQTKSELNTASRLKHDLAEENECTKQRLEESLQQVISVAQIYEAKDNEFSTERQSLMEKHRVAEDGIEEEIVRRRRMEGKYLLLKEKYQGLKEKHEKELRRRDDENREEETRRRDGEKREEEMRRRDEENKRTEARTRRDDDRNSQRRSDKRRPMGTLEFMNSVNSLHDTSMRSERNASRKENDDDTSNRKSTRPDSRSGRQKSSFRIIK